MGVGEAEAFAGEAIDVGRLHAGGAVAAQVAVAEVVGVEEDDVGFAGVGGGSGDQAEAREEEDEQAPRWEIHGGRVGTEGEANKRS
jgi:hypothetical protein